MGAVLHAQEVVEVVALVIAVVNVMAHVVVPVVTVAQVVVLVGICLLFIDEGK